SPVPGGSTFTTSAPKSAITVVAAGPNTKLPTSRTRIPSRIGRMGIPPERSDSTPLHPGMRRSRFRHGPRRAPWLSRGRPAVACADSGWTTKDPPEERRADLPKTPRPTARGPPCDGPDPLSGKGVDFAASHSTNCRQERRHGRDRGGARHSVHADGLPRE